MYTCSVCGYDRLPRRPSDWLLCPCCRTKFGYSDVGRSTEQLRAEWIADGATWGSSYVAKPPAWDAVVQLRNIGYIPTNAEVILMSTGQGVSLVPTGALSD